MEKIVEKTYTKTLSPLKEELVSIAMTTESMELSETYVMTIRGYEVASVAGIVDDKVILKNKERHLGDSASFYKLTVTPLSTEEIRKKLSTKAKKVTINNFSWYLVGEYLYENPDLSGGVVHISSLTNQETIFLEL